jgi:hypothetical protein
VDECLHDSAPFKIAEQREAEESGESERRKNEKKERKKVENGHTEAAGAKVSDFSSSTQATDITWTASRVT